MRYGQIFGDMHSFGTVCCAQARAYLTTGARLVVFLMFSVLAQGVGGGGYTLASHQLVPMVHHMWARHRIHGPGALIDTFATCGPR